jgi:CRISPR/Cas system-associated exonuclease Cas4 (RecB family)
LADFPNELDINRDEIYRNFTKPKEITFMSAPTENIQARYISTWLREKQRLNDGRRTAIVLCNENLLQTVVHCIPSEADKLNITTGFPLAQSPVASLINMLINLQTLGYDPHRKRFRPRLLNNLMRHPYITNVPAELIHPLQSSDDNAPLVEWMCDILTAIARNSNDDTPLFQEAIFKAYTLLNRLLSLIKSGDLLVNVSTLQRLISQIVQSTSIPFHGEPAEGIQIMGVLETRNLDFDHVLLLSCNEGNLPRGVNDTSFIPYNLRKAYGLTTVDHKVAIFSYYFHRLLQRAADVTILYSNATTDSGKGEMSRFMLQLMVEDNSHTITYKTLQAGQQFTPFQPAAVEKTPEVMQTILSHFHPQALLTPTAINRYMRCPLMFYYNYACGLREPDAPVDETIDNRIFGNIFHEASEQIYTRLMEKSRQIMKGDIEQLLKTRVDIERAVDEAISKELFQCKPSERLELNGLQLINREVIIHYIMRLLEIDRDLAPFYIEGLEIDVKAPISTPHISTMVGGRIDRLDRITKDGVELIRVIDYKTGSRQPRPLADVDAIFAPESLQNHSDYYLQAFLYSCIVRSQHPATPVSPALLFIQHSGGSDYDPTICFGKTPINDVADFSQRFTELVTEKIDEIFNPQISFVPTDDRNRCRTCPYKQLCSIKGQGARGKE